MATTQERFETGDRPRGGVPEDYEGQLGDGGLIPTVIESDDDEERCPYCGQWYSRIGSHWAKSSCSHPPISRYKMELLKGMMLGDGGLDMDNKNAFFRIKMTNKTFLEWLDVELGWLTNGVTKAKTAVESAWSARESFGGDTRPEDVLDIWRLNTRAHPQFNEFAEWYSTGEIVFPWNLTLSPEALKMWYVSDWCLGHGNRDNRKTCVRFTSRNEQDRPESIVNSLESLDFTVNHSGKDFALSVEDTEDFFEYIGDPVPGFEYKWAYNDYEEYQRLKEQCREQHCTQTLG